MKAEKRVPEIKCKKEVYDVNCYECSDMKKCLDSDTKIKTWTREQIFNMSDKEIKDVIKAEKDAKKREEEKL